MQRQPERLPFSSILFIVIVIVQNVLRYSTDLASPFLVRSFSLVSPNHLRTISVPSIVSLLLYPNCAVASADVGDGGIGEGADSVEVEAWMRLAKSASVRMV